MSFRGGGNNSRRYWKYELLFQDNIEEANEGVYLCVT